jgi:uncharacterized protein YbjT (DUF2867 family)
MPNTDETVLVTGATGQQGGAVAGELLSHGFKVKAMTRNPEGEKAKALKMRGAEIVSGNLDDASSLEKAMAGVWGVFAVQNTWEAGVEQEEVQGKLTANVARKVGVRHFVYSSVGSAHRRTGIPHFDNKWRIEETVRSLGFPSYTILRPVFFMENWISPWFKPYIDQGSLAMGIKPATKLQMIAVADIGRYGLWAFQHAGQLNGRAIDIAGDELTMPETAEIMSAAAGRKITHFRVPIEEVRKASEDFAAMLEWFDNVGYDVHIESRAKESGIVPTRFRDWAAMTKW